MLIGIILGLMVVAGWQFYPEIKAFLESSTPQSVKEVKEVIRQKVEALKAPPADTSTGVEEKAEVQTPEEKDLAEKTTAAIPEKAEPFYSEEESLWKALLEKTVNPEYVKDYPYADCFTRSAEENGLPLALLLGLAGHLSNFEPDSKVDHRAGIMHLGWPNPSRGMGAEKETLLIDEPCRNIALGSRFLKELLGKSGGDLVPALVAYRDQSEGVHPEDVRKEDILFSSMVRERVEEVLKGPYEKETMYALGEFDSATTARRFIESVRKNSGVDLHLGQKDFKYVVFLPAADENERKEKVALITEKTGIKVK